VVKAATKTPSASSLGKWRKEDFPADEATAYALAVCNGEEMAGPHVRDACLRHLKDLKEGHKRGLVWSVTHVERILRFCRNILKLNGGDFEGKPFDPLPWQCFILGSIFGWLREETGYRRFRVAYQETGKGSGKSPLAGAVGLYMLIADGEERAEVYAAATKKDQAMILFRDAVAMVDQSPALQKVVRKSGKSPNVWNLLYGKKNSFFRPIAADSDSQSGPRPSCALIDELHEHKGPGVIEMLKAGFKFRKQPLLFAITNSGFDMTSVCYDYHEYGAKVSAGSIVDDEFFAYICAHDKGEDPFQDETIWKKTNPSLGHTFNEDYLRSQVTPARSMPSKESTVRRLNFCQWVGANTPWLTSEVWNKNAGPVRPLNTLRGASFYAGLDLSMKNDLSALVCLFPREDEWVTFTVVEDGVEVQRRYPVMDVHCFFWAPEDGITEKEKRDRVPYQAWATAGHLELVPGPVIDYGFIAMKLKEIMEEHELVLLNFDRYRIKDLKDELADLGLEWAEDESPLQEHGQGFKDMSPAIEVAEDMLARGTLRTNDHPVLKWNVSNAVVVKDPAELRKFDKARATGRIDGAVALVMGARATQGRLESGDLDEFLSNPLVLG
jgi:phage terminase large subunit-like protein